MTDGTDVSASGSRRENENSAVSPVESLGRYRLVGIDEIANLTGLSKPTLWRHHATGLIPAGCRIGRSIRWRLRTGNSLTGILDWLEAGCPPCHSNQKGLEA